MNQPESFLSMLVPLATGGTCWLLFVGVCSWGVGHLYFAPLNAPSALFKTDNRFRISDLIILAAHLQLAVAVVLGLASTAPERSQLSLKIGLSITIGVLVCFWWYNGIRMLSRAGVSYTWHRWIFLGVVMPLSYIAAVALIFSFVLVPMSMGILIQSVADSDFSEALGAIAMFTIAIGAIAMIFIGRKYCTTIAQRAAQDRAHRDGIDFDTIQSRNEAQAMGISFLDEANRE